MKSIKYLLFSIAAVFLILFFGNVDASAAELVTGTSNNDELFSSYVDSVFSVPDEDGISISESYASRGSTLSAADKYVYDIVREAAVAIANGSRSSTVITFSPTYLEEITGDTQTTAHDVYSLANVIYALLDDCPYELYWYDKTSATRSDYSNGLCEIFMPVIREYSSEQTAGTYETDTGITGAATSAASNAQSVAADAYGESWYQALDYYRGWICDNVDYDYDAPGSVYGNPWQMIWVFDKDSSTKVVCEGYAKAFKYLCDLYLAQNPSAEEDCYIVEGTINTLGAHMWNLVTMGNGKNYLVDVTNCDAGSDDQRRFFLVGSDQTFTAEYNNTTRLGGYTVTGLDGTVITYRYQRTTSSGRVAYISYAMYTDEELGISTGNYDPTDLTDTFTDVRNKNSFYYDAVYWAVENGVTVGTSDTAFSPEEDVTRAQFVTFLWRLDGRKTVEDTEAFTDLPENDDYRSAILWATANNITYGKGNRRFAPNDTVTRAESVTFLQRWLGGSSAASTQFSDVASSSYYSAAVGWAVKNGVTNGTSATTFEPGTKCNRGQAATFIYRAAM